MKTHHFLPLRLNLTLQSPALTAPVLEVVYPVLHGRQLMDPVPDA